MPDTPPPPPRSCSGACVFGGVDRTDLAHQAVEALRGRINPRWSHAF